MSPALGMLSYIGWGRETTYGTSVSRTKFSELVAEAIKLEQQQAFSDSVRGPSRRRHYVGKRFVAGDFTVEPMYEGYELLYENLFGAVVTANIGTGAFSHTFSLADTRKQGLSIEVERNSQTAGQAFLYEGCGITKAVFTMTPDKLLKAVFSVVGEDESLVTKTAALYPPENPILHTAALVELDDVAFDCNSFEVTLDETLDSDRRKIGSSLIKFPSRAGMRTLSGSFEVDFDNTTTHYAKYRNNTEFKLKLVIVGGQIAASGQNYRWALTLPRCIAIGETPPIDTAGALRQRINFVCLFDVAGAADAAQLICYNALTSV